MRPTVKRISAEAAASKQQDQALMTKPPMGNFLTRPDSNGDDVQTSDFSFAPANPRILNIPRLGGKCPAPPTTAQAIAKPEMQCTEEEHQYSSQGRSSQSNAHM